MLQNLREVGDFWLNQNCKYHGHVTVKKFFFRIFQNFDFTKFSHRLVSDSYCTTLKTFVSKSASKTEYLKVTSAEKR